MANKAKTKPDVPREDTAFVRRLLMKALLAVVLLLLTLSLLSYNAEDAQILAGGIGRHSSGIDNWIGPFGATISSFCIRWIGVAVYPATALLFLCVLIRLCLRNLRPVTGVYFAAAFTTIFGFTLFLGNFPNFLEAATASLNIEQTPGGVIGQRFCEPWVVEAGVSSGGWLSYVIHPLGCIIVSLAMITVGLVTIGYFDWRFDLQRVKSLFSKADKKKTEKKKREKVAKKREKATEPAPEEAVIDADAAVFKGEVNADWDAAADTEAPKIEEEEPEAVPEAEPEPIPETPEPTLAEAAEVDNWPVVQPLTPPPRRTNQSGVATTPVDYKLPTLQLLKKIEPGKVVTISPKEISAKKEVLQETLDSFGIDASVGETTSGPRVTLFEIRPAAGVRVEKISSLANNIAMSLKAESLRIMTPIPGKDTVGIEVPNSVSAPVSFRELQETPAFSNSKAKIPIALGKDISGKPVILDLASAPHLLIAGATGSGKSVCMNTLILSLLYRFRPDELKMIMVDPKVVEFKGYETLPHLVTPVVTETKKVPVALRWVLNQMEWRYKVLSKVGVRNIASYNDRKLSDEPVLDDDGIQIPDKLPYLVLIIDELADIMMTAKADVETSLARIAQLARAVGIHAVIATQRPSVNVITGIIKANFPTRIAFQVTSVADSRTILDGKGAESLLGKGDALFKPPGGSRLSRTQGAFTPDEDIERVVDFVSAQAQPDFVDDIFSKPDVDGSGELMPELAEDGDVVAPAAAGLAAPKAAAAPKASGASDGDEELVQRAIQIIMQDQRATTSHIQRKLRIGYNRAALIIETLEQRGIIGPQVGTAPRQVLLDEDTLAATETN
jgi:S-DNA-T family DNA segregation ATPase FtsK/SpoIIIE